MALDKADVIFRTMLKSEHDCMTELLFDLDDKITEEQDLIKIVNQWIDILQDKFDSAERLEDVENAIYCAQSSMEDIQNNLDDLGGHLNV